MENSSVDYKKQSVNFGVIFGLYSSILLWLSYKYEFDESLLMSLISITVAVIVVFLPIKQYKENNADLLKLSEALKIGLIVGLISGLIYGIYTYFHYKSIDVEFIPLMLKESHNALLESSNSMPEEQIEQSKQMIETMLSPFTLATFALFNLLFKSFIISLIIGLIKKN